MKIGKSISIQYWNVQDIVNLMDKKVYDWQLIRAGQGYVEIIHLAAGLLTPGQIFSVFRPEAEQTCS